MQNENCEIDWLTDIATLKLPSAATSGITNPEIAGWAQLGRNLIGVPEAERQLSLYARRNVDVYAMLVPYRVTIVDKTTVPVNAGLPVPSAEAPPAPSTERSDMDLLGFYGGMTFAGSGVNASSAGFQSKGCKHPSDVFRNSPVGNDEDFRYCYLFRDPDEALTLNFYRDELVAVDYHFGASRYDGLLRELSAKYGNPRTSTDNDNWRGWGSAASTMLDIDKTTDHTEGFSDLTFNRGQPMNASARVANPEPGFATYTNARFGFAVEYPRAFAAKRPPDNGDGLEFVSPDGTATLVVTAGNNDGSTLKEYYDRHLRSVTGELGYCRLGGNWFVITWRNGSTLSYLKMFVGPGSQNSFTFSFPESQRAQYDVATTKIEKSFRPGQLDQAW